MPTIIIETDDEDLILAAFSELPSMGISVEQEMLKAIGFSNGLKAVAITFALSAAHETGEILPQWIYDKVKNQTEQKTVINGTQINTETITLQSIQVFIDCKTDQNIGDITKESHSI